MLGWVFSSLETDLKARRFGVRRVVEDGMSVSGESKYRSRRERRALQTDPLLSASQALSVLPFRCFTDPKLEISLFFDLVVAS